MLENEKATRGKLVAGTGSSANGNHAQAHDSTNLPVMSSEDAHIADFSALLEQAKVEPADVLSAKKVQALIDMAARYQGHARQAMLDGLRLLIGHLPSEERQALNLYQLFEPPKQKEQIESYLASCPAAPGSPKFAPKSLADLMALPPKQWLIDQLIGICDVGMLFGPPGSAKTFLIIDLIFSACLGRLFAMRFDVPRALQVALCAGEGVSGLPQRFAAAAEFYGVDDLPNFTFYDAAPQLFNGETGDLYTATIREFVREWRDRQAAGSAKQLDLLVIDTLHSATVGADENSAQDMGKVLQALKAASRELGCAVLLVHHSNKQGNAERGSSAMRGAMDTMLSVYTNSSKYVLSCEKAKDAAAWKPQTFDLVAMGDSVRVWWDEPADANQVNGQKAADKERLMAELKRYAGKRFTAKSLGEVVAKGDNYTRNLLSELEREGKCKRELQDADKQQSSRNPWVYYVIAAGSTEGETI